MEKITNSFFTQGHKGRWKAKKIEIEQKNGGGSEKILFPSLYNQTPNQFFCETV